MVAARYCLFLTLVISLPIGLRTGCKPVNDWCVQGTGRVALPRLSGLLVPLRRQCMQWHHHRVLAAASQRRSRQMTRGGTISLAGRGSQSGESVGFLGDLPTVDGGGYQLYVMPQFSPVSLILTNSMTPA